MQSDQQSGAGVDYDEDLVHRTLRALKDKDLVVLSWQGAGSRVVKYAQTFAQRRGLAPDERALMTVLLLRGPQPAGALKTRTERLHRFRDRGEVAGVPYAHGGCRGAVGA